ncbi:GH-E family nuclease [Microbacterium sp. NPDC055903]
MSAIKPVIRELKQAGVKGLRHMDEKLHQVGDNIAEGIDDVVKKVKGQDRFDDPTGSSTPGSGQDGPLRDDRGRFAPNPDSTRDSTYDRPSGWRAGMRDRVWDDAMGRDGIVRDPVSGDPLNKNEPWIMGHAPGYEFRHHQRSAQERGITREQFLEEYYTMMQYRPESPHTSSSGSHELGWDDYVGP